MFIWFYKPCQTDTPPTKAIVFGLYGFLACLAKKQEDVTTDMGFIMTAVQITYFEAMDVQSKARILDMIGPDIPHIVANAARQMKNNEGFACFTAPDGKVIALDKYAQFVMV